MAESLLIKKSAGGVKLAGTEVTLTAAEVINKDEFVREQVIGSTKYALKSTSGQSVRQIVNQGTGFSLPNASVDKSIFLKDSNLVVAMGPSYQSGNQHNCVVQVFSVNPTTGSISVYSNSVTSSGNGYSSGVPYQNGTGRLIQIGPDLILATYQNYATSDNGTGRARRYMIVRLQGTTLTKTEDNNNWFGQYQYNYIFSQPTWSGLVVGDYLLWSYYSGGTQQVYSYFINQSTGTITSVTSISALNSGGGFYPAIIKINETLIAFATETATYNSYSLVNGSQYLRTHFSLIRINPSNGSLTKINDTDYQFYPSYNPGFNGLASLKNSLNKFVLIGDFNQAQPVTYLIQDNNTSNFPVTQITNTLPAYTSHVLGPIYNDRVYRVMAGSPYSVDELKFNNLNEVYIYNQINNSSISQIRNGQPSGGYSFYNTYNFSTTDGINTLLTVNGSSLSMFKYEYLNINATGIAKETKNAGESVKILKLNPAINITI
jgi:hypothetical protein